MTDKEEQKNAILLAEYKAAVDGCHHYDSFRWSAGSILIAGSFVFWSIFLRDKAEMHSIVTATVFITALLSVWLFFAHHYRQCYMTKVRRIHELERQLDMELNVRLGFFGQGGEYEIYGCKGHILDIFIYIIASSFGPVFICQRSGIDWWMLLPISLMVFTVVKVLVYESKMKKLHLGLQEHPDATKMKWLRRIEGFIAGLVSVLWLYLLAK